jgi:Carboxypeptidase regulatory-like domain
MNGNLRIVRTVEKMYWVVFILLCAMTAAPAWGQATAQIHGTVQDSSGAEVPGATVSATQTDTGVTRTVTSEADGGYVLTALPLGPYRLVVTKEGFSKAVQTGIVLAVNSDPAVYTTLKVGSTTESISVDANTMQVETRSVGVSTALVDTQQILDLPLNGRQVTDLVTLNGLSIQTGTSPSYNMPTGVNISVAGGTSYSVQYNLDGASHLDTYDGTNMPFPFPDALQEFRLTTSTQDASGGGHSGATVNAVTKSGTNSFHGDAFEFFRNAALNGKDYFASKNDSLKRNQFGGVIGGPIVKNKLFFFAGYQGTMTRQNPTSITAFVPTAAMLTGDFSAYVANGCGRFNPGVLDGSNHLALPLSLSPAAVAIGSKLPTPTDACGTVKTGEPLHENDLQATARVDYQLSAKQSIFGGYLITRVEKAIPYSLRPNDMLTTGYAGSTGADDTAQSLTLGDTYVFGPTLVNSFRIFGNRVGGNQLPGLNLDPASVGITNLYSGYTPGLLSMTVSGAFNIGFNENFAMTQEAVSNFGLNDDVTLIRGSHQISFGGQAMRAILVENSYAWAPGVYIFVPARTGNALGDFLTGNFVQFHQANPNPNDTTQNFFGLYAGDMWRATSRLTLNYGVRWNPFFPMQFINGDTDSFSLSAFYANERSKVVPSAPPGFTYPGDPGFPGRSGLNHKFDNFEPRFGFAWDPSGNGKMAIRGGAGIAYDFIRQDLHQNTSSVAPFRLTVVNSLGQGTLDNPYKNVPGGNPFPYNYDPKNPVFPTFPSYQAFYPIPSNIRSTEQYSWNLAIQRQVTRSLLASATYVGTHLIHTWTAVDLNPGQYIPGNCVAGQYGLTAPGLCTQSTNVNGRRLLELTNPSAGNLLGPMTSLDDGGTQSYNGLLLNATWRRGNVYIAGNYTWSHCIGLAQIGVTNSNSTYPHQPYQNTGPVNKYLDYGDCFNGALDTRNMGNLTMVLTTPKFSDTWVGRLGTGWTFSSILTARTGYPLTPVLSTDVAQNGLIAPAGNYPIPQRPNILSTNTAAADRGQQCAGVKATCVSWFDPAAFTLPAAGTYGNLGVGTLRSPGFWEWDQTIAKQFKIREAQSLEFRVEAFNVTNSVRFYVAPIQDPASTMTVNGSTFGKIREAASTTGSAQPYGSGGRIIQLAIKYAF